MFGRNRMKAGGKTKSDKREDRNWEDSKQGDIKREAQKQEDTKRGDAKQEEGRSEDIGLGEAEAAAAWTAEDEELDARLEELMKGTPDTSRKQKKKSFLIKPITFIKNICKSGAAYWKTAGKKKKIAIIAAFCVLFVLLSRCHSGKEDGGVPVMVEPLQSGEIKEELTVSGPVSGTDSVDVVSGLHAEVLTIQVKEGDRVKAGQTLALIDSSAIQKEVDIAQNTYDLAVSTYNEQQILAENGYAKACQDYETAKADFERTNVLFESGSVSRVEWENAKNKMDEAGRQTRTYTIKDGRPVANESYGYQVKEAEFQLEKKKEQLEDAVVTSPIDGTVVRVNAKVGRFADTIEDDKPMFIIDNLDILEMKINISEYSIGKVAVGQSVEISADILNGETVSGQVTAISPTGEEKGGGSTERVIPTTVRITEDDSRLIAGITARAKILLREAKDAWIVPAGALLEKEDGAFVAAEENGILKMIPVETGVEGDLNLQIVPKEEGTLAEGMNIVTNPSPDMTDGMKVSVLPSGL